MMMSYRAALGLLASAAFAMPASAAIVFTPLSSSAVNGSLPAAEPFKLAEGFTQKTLFTNTENGLYRSGGTGNSNFDMIVTNETGRRKGRYLFTVNETGDGGLVRYDRVTDTPVQLFAGALDGINLRALDPVRWTPWGTVIIGEEVDGGRLIEIVNPLADPADLIVKDRPNIGRVAWEGIAWDSAGNTYYQDEDNNGAIYKWVPNQAAANFDPKDESTSPLAGTGQLFALRVNAANVEQREGVAEWVPLTDANGVALPGIPDPYDDAQASADAVNATNYRRPEDLHLVVRDGRAFIIVAATTADAGSSPSRHHVYSIELTSDTNATVRSFVDDAVTLDEATGLPVDRTSNIFANPDNIAIDNFGDIWIVEDNTPGDIWKATWGTDGVATSIARFASLSSVGAEPTGLYFDPFHPNRMWVNVQHPSDLVDRMIEIQAVPAPAAFVLFGLGVAGLVARRRAA